MADKVARGIAFAALAMNAVAFGLQYEARQMQADAHAVPRVSASWPVPHVDLNDPVRNYGDLGHTHCFGGPGLKGSVVYVNGKPHCAWSKVYAK